MFLLHLREKLALFAEKPVPFTILCIAIDQLEDLKRHDGPAVAVPLLDMVGLTLENSLRPTDFIGRWGENEFLVILTECTAEGAVTPWERFRRLIGETEVEWWGDRRKVSATFGGAEARAGDDVEGLLARAEGALHEARNAGGNRVALRGN